MHVIVDEIRRNRRGEREREKKREHLDLFVSVCAECVCLFNVCCSMCALMVVLMYMLCFKLGFLTCIPSLSLSVLSVLSSP